MSLLWRSRLGPGYGLHGSGLAGDWCLLLVLLASCEGSSDPQGSCRGTTGNCRRTGGERRGELQGDAPYGESQGRLRNADDLEPRMSRHSGLLAPIVYFCASTGCAETLVPAQQPASHGSSASARAGGTVWQLRFPVGAPTSGWESGSYPGDTSLYSQLSRSLHSFPPAFCLPSVLPPQYSDLHCPNTDRQAGVIGAQADPSAWTARSATARRPRSATGRSMRRGPRWRPRRRPTWPRRLCGSEPELRCASASAARSGARASRRLLHSAVQPWQSLSQRRAASRSLRSCAGHTQIT